MHAQACKNDILTNKKYTNKRNMTASRSYAFPLLKRTPTGFYQSCGVTKSRILPKHNYSFFKMQYSIEAFIVNI